jgi:serine/threonine protein kinase/Leucine-rich repeat (LRR) protein
VVCGVTNSAGINATQFCWLRSILFCIIGLGHVAPMLSSPPSCNPGYAGIAIAGASLSGVECFPCPIGSYSPQGVNCVYAPIGGFAPHWGLSHYLPCPESRTEGATNCSDVTANGSSQELQTYQKLGPQVFLEGGRLESTASLGLAETNWTVPETDKNWTGWVIKGEESSHSQFIYIAYLFDRIYQKGVYTSNTIGYFDYYDSDTGTYYLSGGDSDWCFGTYRGGTATFECSKATSFSVMEAPTCYYTLHYFSPEFCPGGAYTYLPGDPTLYPTAAPTPAPTLHSNGLPAYALTEDYVKEVLLTMDGGAWAILNRWYDSADLDQWPSLKATIDNSTGVRRLAAPIEMYHYACPTASSYYYYSSAYLTIPTELELLKDCISVLSMSTCNLYSTLPDFLANFTYLEQLVLYENYIFGTIPEGLGSLPKLKEIYLQSNQLYGSIPQDLFLNAQTVTIGSNQLTGSLPSQFGANLEYLDLSNNQIWGTIPSELGDTDVKRIDLYGNSLSGVIPGELCDLALFELYLGANELGCYEACLNVGVTDVTNYYTRCQSDIDTAICDISEGFNVSNALATTLVAGIPTSYSTDHPLPTIWEETEYFSFSDAEYLQISFSCESELATSLLRIYDGDGHSLFDAFLLDSDSVPGCGSESPLTVSVTAIMIVYTNWMPLYTYGFDMTVTPLYYASGWSCGTADDEIIIGRRRLSSTSDIYAGDYCSWYGITCQSDIAIVGIDLSAMGLEGTLPDSLTFLQNLEVLNLGYNSIAGTLPTVLGSLTTLTSINLAANRFSGTLPTELAKLGSLETLSVSSNYLTGTVSAFLGSMTSLKSLDLSTNNFGGKLSAGLCSLVEDEEVIIKLQDNYITCYESHCYADAFGNATGTIRFDNSVAYCYPTSMPTASPTAEPTTVLHASEVAPVLSAGGIAGVCVGVTVFFCLYYLVNQHPMVKYMRHPIHKAIATGEPVTEELLSANREEIMVLVNGNSVVDLVFAMGSKCSISGIVLGKLIMMRMFEEEAKMAEEAVLKDGQEGCSSLEDSATGLDIQANIEEIASLGLEMINSARHQLEETAEKFKDEVEDAFGVLSRAHKFRHNQVDLGGMNFMSGILRDWVQLVQEEGERAQEAVYHILQTMPNKIDLFSECTDSRGRRCLDIASIPCKEILRRCSYLCNRYEIKIGPPEHISATSVVVFAVDHGEWTFEPIRLSEVSNEALFRSASQENATKRFSYANSRDGTDGKMYSSLVTKSSQPKDVCLKFMHNKEQYLTEIEVRNKAHLDPSCVIAVLRCFDGDRVAAAVTTDSDDPEGTQAHNSADTHHDHLDVMFRNDAISKGFDDYPYCIVMVKADHSLKHIIDHNHIVGNDWDTIKTIFRQVTHAVDHMHGRKMIHGDLKPMNIMQADGRMLLIDLDASASFSEDDHQYAGAKYSSAYVPPELICIGSDGNARVRVPPTASTKTSPTLSPDSVALRSASSDSRRYLTTSSRLASMSGSRRGLTTSSRLASISDSRRGLTASSRLSSMSFHLGKSIRMHHRMPSVLDLHITESEELSEERYSLVKASAAIDMWSLGCILYLLCTGMSLFRATVEDNIGSDVDLRALMEWSIKTKLACLAIVEDKLARNLISLLLMKDPAKRLDCSHVLSHPFLAGRSPGRLQGELPQFDVFLSYRVSSDAKHAKQLYEILEARGLKVWWDKKCLLPGQPWEEGFCAGLANSGHFVCLLSRGAINSSDKAWENFSNLQVSSRCDNVLLEWRLALELKRRGMIEGVFPILIGDMMEDKSTHAIEYSHYNRSGCGPKELPTCSVASVEQKLRERLDHEGLGAPFEEEMAVSDIVKEVLANQGGFIVHDPQTAWNTVVNQISRMIEVTADKYSQHGQLLESPRDGNAEAEHWAAKYDEVLQILTKVQQENEAEKNKRVCTLCSRMMPRVSELETIEDVADEENMDAEKSDIQTGASAVDADPVSM